LHLFELFNAASVPFCGHGYRTAKQIAEAMPIFSRCQYEDFAAFPPAIGRPARQKAPGKMRRLSNNAMRLFAFWAALRPPNIRPSSVIAHQQMVQARALFYNPGLSSVSTKRRDLRVLPSQTCGAGRGGFPCASIV
jgi:hypothetical protein